MFGTANGHGVERSETSEQFRQAQATTLGWPSGAASNPLDGAPHTIFSFSHPQAGGEGLARWTSGFWSGHGVPSDSEGRATKSVERSPLRWSGQAIHRAGPSTGPAQQKSRSASLRQPGDLHPVAVSTVLPPCGGSHHHRMLETRGFAPPRHRGFAFDMGESKPALLTGLRLIKERPSSLRGSIPLDALPGCGFTEFLACP